MSSPVYSHDGDGKGTEAVVVSSDSHSERGILSAHSSQWRSVKLDKVSHGIGLFQLHLSVGARFHARIGAIAKEDPGASPKELPVQGTRQEHTDRALSQGTMMGTHVDLSAVVVQRRHTQRKCGCGVVQGLVRAGPMVGQSWLEVLRAGSLT